MIRRKLSRTLVVAGAACVVYAGTPAGAAPCAGFEDVSNSDTAYCSAVSYLKSKGITTGCGDGSNYCPNDYVTRLQMALFLQRMGRGGPNNVQPTAINTIGGGNFNESSGGYATVAGGTHNQAVNADATVGGGDTNTASGAASVVAGGSENSATASNATVSGGGLNHATGSGSTVAGGYSNEAAGNFSYAAGYRSRANGYGSFSWADQNNFDFNTNTPNSFRVRATGGVRFVVDIDGSGDTTWSCLLTTGNGWACTSDREQKQDFVELDGGAVLDRLAAMPVYAWSPKGRNAHLRHYGPTAQDFHAAFGLGDTDVMIGQQDADGVALAAIKGLHAKVLAENAVLRGELEAIKSMLATLARDGR